ncbi:hypothetical protein C9F11_45630 (plasmid) [Streptomyces sp. YIM 121038]|uniref:DUF6211 family protein n=1 Tax=Streptomyces sp. YIM 121038 TaxID=2136401 RepID=UPI001110C287|nr:DUF6211 family protein [Streptomyces sp. YIM 121038]QCX82684.1 hypothetical protein C9F11_45630 [Streptomyces sp. YIM 121038]
MLSDPHPDRPRPGDIAQLRAGNSIDAEPGDAFVIAEDVPPGIERVVLNLPVGHPNREDWAAAISEREVASLTRLGSAGARTWSPAADPEADT